MCCVELFILYIIFKISAFNGFDNILIMRLEIQMYKTVLTQTKNYN